MMRVVIRLWPFLFLSTTLYSCAYIFGRKSKQITFYLERDSCGVIYENKSLNRSPFTITASNQKKSINLDILYQQDTLKASYRRKYRDIFFADVLALGFPLGVAYWYLTAEQDPQGRVFNYPRRLYIDPTAKNNRILSPWPRVKKGWTRLCFGIPLINSVNLDTGANNINMTGVFGISTGGEYYFANNYSLWADAGYAFSGSSGTTASYIDSTDHYSAAAYFANIGVSRHFGRWALGMGVGASQLRYIYQQPDYLSTRKDPIYLYNITINKFNFLFKLNYWLKPNSSIYLTYSPSFATPDGTNYTHIISFGWTLNLPIIQPNRYRSSFDDMINKPNKYRKTAKSPQSSGN